MEFVFIVNGNSHQVDVPPMKRLLDVLREDGVLLFKVVRI